MLNRFIKRQCLIKNKSERLSNKKTKMKNTISEDAEKNLNAKILKITMTIMEQYPELSKYIEEMPVTIPNEKIPEITLDNLKAYFESLNTMLNKYKTEHPAIGN